MRIYGEEECLIDVFQHNEGIEANIHDVAITPVVEIL